MPINRIGIIGYASGVGGNIPGCEFTPSTLRSLQICERLRSLGPEIKDFGDVTGQLSLEDEQLIYSQASSAEQLARNVPAVFTACSRLHDKTLQALCEGYRPFILGGDHSLSIGSVAAVANHLAAQNAKIGLIWIDTHADINTPESSPSKNIFGMSVAVLLGIVPGVLAGLQKAPPAVSFSNLCYIGLRDLDSFERQIIRQRGISAYTMKEIDTVGMAAVVREAIAVASRGTAGFVVSFDLDVCDPMLAPATGTPIRGGLTYREAHLALELLAESNKMLACEMVEYNPRLDRDAATAQLTLSFLESAAGKSIL